MFESKIDPDDLAILIDRWAEDSCRIGSEEIQAIKARLARLENAMGNLVMALSGKRLPN